MARNMLPMKNGNWLTGKLIGVLVTVSVLVLVVKYPGDAASWVTGAAHLLTNIVSGLVAFFRQLGH
jgi:Ca2+/H+ antiporter